MTSVAPHNSRFVHTHRFFFVHLMKTGGTTFWHQLAANFDPAEIYPYPEIDRDMDRAYTNIDYLRSQPPMRIRRMRCFAAHLPFFVTDELGDDLVTMTILRDPVARALSHLKQIRGALPSWEGRSLEDVYDGEQRARERQLHNHQVRFFALKPEDDAESFLDPVVVDADRLAHSKANLACVDVVGLHDRLQDFHQELEQRFGLRMPSVPNQRVSVPSEVSPSFRRRLEHDNAAEVEFYEYARSLALERRAGEPG